MQIGCDLLTSSPGHDVTGQGKKLERDWEADALVYSRLPSLLGSTMHGLSPQLLVSSVNAVLGLAHAPVHNRAGNSQCHPGVSEGHQKPPGIPIRRTGELMSAVRRFTLHSV